MKYLAVLSIIIIGLVSAQRPVPLPFIQLPSFQGQWYVVFQYSNESTFNSSSPYFATCTLYNVDITPSANFLDTASFSQAYPTGSNSSTSFQTPYMGSIWDFTQSGNPIFWVGYDFINGSWATGGYANSQSALILSRNPTLATGIVNSQIALLVTEGYLINSTNSYVYNNTGC